MTRCRTTSCALQGRTTLLMPVTGHHHDTDGEDQLERFDLNGAGPRAWQAHSARYAQARLHCADRLQNEQESNQGREGETDLQTERCNARRASPTITARPRENNIHTNRRPASKQNTSRDAQKPAPAALHRLETRGRTPAHYAAHQAPEPARACLYVPKPTLKRLLKAESACRSFA